MSKSSKGSKLGAKAPYSLTRSAVRRAVHSVFDDLRRDPVPPEGGPFLATLTGMNRSGRTSAVSSYVATRAAQDAIERGLFSVGTPANEVKAKQELVVDIAVSELLNSMPPNIIHEALRQPALFLRRASALARRGTTELVMLDGFDELLRRASGAAASSMTPTLSIGLEAAKGFARAVGTPVVHVSNPVHRRNLTQDPNFCRTWRWEVDMFCMSEDETANADYMKERFRSLGLLKIAPGGYPMKRDPNTGYLPGVVFSARGERVGAVSPSVLAEAVKSCGAGSGALVVDVYEGTSYAALLHFEPAVRLT